MKKKTSRRRIDVNVDELDRIIEAAMQAPLNEADGRTLKTAVHAMAERLVRRRNTEKTSAVLEPKAPPAAVDTPPTGETGGCGTRAQRGICIYGSKQSSGRACHTSVRRSLPGMQRRKSVPPERTGDADPHCGTASAGSDRVRDGKAALQWLWRGIHRRRTAVGGPGKVRCHCRGYDRAFEIWHGNAL